MSLLLATLANSSVNVFVAFLFLLFLRVAVAAVVEVVVESLLSLLVAKAFPRELEPLALGVASISTASLGVDEDGAAVTAVDVDEEDEEIGVYVYAMLPVTSGVRIGFNNTLPSERVRNCCVGEYDGAIDCLLDL